MGKLLINDDEKKTRAFEDKIQKTLTFLKNCHDHTYYQTFATILSDNIKYFNRVKELEDETDKRDADKG